LEPAATGKFENLLCDFGARIFHDPKHCLKIIGFQHNQGRSEVCPLNPGTDASALDVPVLVTIVDKLPPERFCEEGLGFL